MRGIILHVMLVCWLAGQTPVANEEAEPGQAGNDSRSPAATEPAVAESVDSDRTSLNLLGEVDAESGEGRRNENVKLTLIDNNVLKELNTRMGTTATVTQEFEIDKGYFGSQYGGSGSRSIHVSASGSTGFHGNVFWSHNNSAFSARSFFQVGKVQPAWKRLLVSQQQRIQRAIVLPGGQGPAGPYERLRLCRRLQPMEGSAPQRQRQPEEAARAGKRQRSRAGRA
jgi:hypothetical protein